MKRAAIGARGRDVSGESQLFPKVAPAGCTSKPNEREAQKKSENKLLSVESQCVSNDRELREERRATFDSLCHHYQDVYQEEGNTTRSTKSIKPTT